MQYMGGKSRIVRYFRRIIDQAIDANGPAYYEPFVGGYNIVPALGRRPPTIVCSDLHPGLAPLYRAVRDGWKPPEELSEEKWHELRTLRDWSDPLTAFAAFGVSFGGTEFGSFADKEGTQGKYCRAARNSLLRKAPSMSGVKFTTQNYQEIATPRQGVIYCDPPYRGTAGYKGVERFDVQAFDDWCREKTREGHVVLVSEFTAPDDWTCVWEIDRPVTMAAQGSYDTRYDRLFLVPGSVLDGRFGTPERQKQGDLFDGF